MWSVARSAWCLSTRRSAFSGLGGLQTTWSWLSASNRAHSLNAGNPDVFGDLSEPLERSAGSAAQSAAAASRRTELTSAEPGLQRGTVDWDLAPDDPEDVTEAKLQEVIAQIPKLGITAQGYARKIKAMIKNGKLQEALQLFQHQMLAVDRVRPDEYCFNLLISGCAQAGYTKMAFKLYNDMKRRGLRPKHVTYTSLLTACANGPSRREGLARIRRLTEIMAEKGYAMNAINYHALIRAYGRCGALEAAFSAADEMTRLGFPVTADTAGALLQACISDTEHGFRHALLVWRQMRWRRVAPSVLLYNLLLRAALDCGAGDGNTCRRALQLVVSGPAAAATEALPAAGSAESTAEPAREPQQERLQEQEPERERLQEQEPERERLPGREPAVREAEREQSGLPDLLSETPSLGGLISVDSLDSAEHRLAVLGSWTGVVQAMAGDGLQPDIKTFSLLLSSLPGDRRQEQCLLRTMEALQVSPDVGFFNQLVKKRAARRDMQAAKAAFTELSSRGLSPDIASFGCLAMTVRSLAETSDFLQTLRDADVRPNLEVLTTLLNAAVRATEPYWVLLVMETFVTHTVRPDRRALIRLEQFRLTLRRLTVDRERGRRVPAAVRSASFPEGVRTFQLRYSRWLAEVEVEAEKHVHAQYRVPPLVPQA